MFHFPSVPLTSKLFLLIKLLFGRVRERYKLSCTTRAWQEAIAKDLSPIRGSVLELHRILNSQNPEPRTQNPDVATTYRALAADPGQLSTSNFLH